LTWAAFDTSVVTKSPSLPWARRACRPCDRLAGLVFDIALDVPEAATCFHDFCLGSQRCLADGAEKVDLQLDSCERLVLSQRGGVGVTHRRISQVTVDAAVQRTHRVVAALIDLHFKDRMAWFKGLHDEPEQASNRRRSQVAPQDFLT